MCVNFQNFSRSGLLELRVCGREGGVENAPCFEVFLQYSPLTGFSRLPSGFQRWTI